MEEYLENKKSAESDYDRKTVFKLIEYEQILFHMKNSLADLKETIETVISSGHDLSDLREFSYCQQKVYLKLKQECNYFFDEMQLQKGNKKLHSLLRKFHENLEERILNFFTVVDERLSCFGIKVERMCDLIV
jgi:hypothetical protein